MRWRGTSKASGRRPLLTGASKKTARSLWLTTNLRQGVAADQSDAFMVSEAEKYAPQLDEYVRVLKALRN